MFRQSLLLLAALISWTSQALGAESTIIIGLRGEADETAVTALITQLGGEIRSCGRETSICTVDFASGRALPLAALARHPSIRWVEADRRFEPPTANHGDDGHIFEPPRPFDDAEGTPQCPRQWELYQIGADLVWPSFEGGDAPAIAVVDNGVLSSHQELVGHITGQYDYANMDDTAEVEWDVEFPGHGSFICGLIAAEPDNGIIRAGLAPLVDIFFAKVADASGAFYISYAIDALNDILDNHTEVRIISYSLSAAYSAAMEEVIGALGDAGVLVVTAAGNCTANPDCADGNIDDNPLYPASYEGEHIVVVTSSDTEDQLDVWSHYGPETVDLAAPAVHLCSLGVDDDTAVHFGEGTSYATPIVAAAAALLWEAHPDLTAHEIARVLRESSHRSTALEGLMRSGGRLDLAAAVATAVPRLQPPEDLVVDGTLDVELALENVGAAGEASLVFFHSSELSLEAGAGWSAVSFSSGEVVTLPGVGEVDAPGDGTVVSGDAGGHTTMAVPLTAYGRAIGQTTVTLRAAMSSDGASFMPSPADHENQDLSEHPAYSFDVEVIGIASTGDADADSDADGDTDADGDGDGDGDGDADGDGDGDSDGGPDEDDDGCTCAPVKPRLGTTHVVLELIMGAIS